MIRDLRITVLVENTVRRPDLLAEHGWALWIEANGRHIMFDTDQGKILCENARHLDIPLDATDTPIVCHAEHRHIRPYRVLLSPWMKRSRQ